MVVLTKAKTRKAKKGTILTSRVFEQGPTRAGSKLGRGWQRSGWRKDRMHRPRSIQDGELAESLRRLRPPNHFKPNLQGGLPQGSGWDAAQTTRQRSPTRPGGPAAW